MNDETMTPPEGFFPGPDPTPNRDRLAELMTSAGFVPVVAGQAVRVRTQPIAGRMEFQITAPSAETMRNLLASPAAVDWLRESCERYAGRNAARESFYQRRLATKTESVNGTNHEPSNAMEVDFEPEELEPPVARNFVPSLAWFLVRLFLFAMVVPIIAGLAIFLVNVVATFVVPVILVAYLFLRLDPRNSSNRLDGKAFVRELSLDEPTPTLKPIAGRPFRRPLSDLFNL